MNTQVHKIIHYKSTTTNPCDLESLLEHSNVQAAVEVICNKLDLMKSLYTEEPDLIVLGSEPATGLANEVAALKSVYPDIPLIVTGPENEMDVSDFLSNGASCYIADSQISMLPSAIEWTIMLRKAGNGASGSNTLSPGIISAKPAQVHESECAEGMRHAALIVNAMLQSETDLKHVNDQSFVIHRPKNIIGGDLYFFVEVPHGFLIVSADCTGHGISGALLSMAVYHLLTHIITYEKITRPAEIVNQLDRRIRKSLHKTERDHPLRDGVDVSVCLVNRKRKMIEFSGANQTLFYFFGQRLVEFRSEKRTAGEICEDCSAGTLTHKIDYQPGDRFYLVTDGFYDQFGGPNDSRMMKKNFAGLLKLAGDLPMQEQKKFFETKFEEWKAGNEQTDDMQLIGMEL